MPDFDFTLQRPFPEGDWRAVRNLYYVLAGTPDMAKAYATVLKLWRARAAQLYQAGWSPLRRRHTIDDGRGGGVSIDDRRRLQHLRNCVPAGAAFDRGAWFCQANRICPWCYGRKVVAEAYRSAAFALKTIGRDNLGAVQLVGLRGLLERPETLLPWDNSEQGWSQEVTNSLRRGYEALGGARTCMGAFSRTAMAPADNGNLSIYRGTLAITAKSARLPKIDTLRVVAAGYDNLRKLVAWCFPYPKGMLFGDVPTTVRILEGLSVRRAKSVVSIGICNNSRMRDEMKRMRKEMAAASASAPDDDMDTEDLDTEDLDVTAKDPGDS